MRKKFKKLAVAGLLTGCLTVGTVGAYAMASGNAYQNYKQAAMDTAIAQNMTVAADVTVKQDGVVIISGDAFTQTADAADYSLIRMQVNGETMEREKSENGDVRITRDGDVYTSRDVSDDDWGDEHDDFAASSSQLKLVDMIADLLVGNTQNHFTGSGDSVIVNLDEAQIPELLNVAVSAAVEQNASRRGHKSDDSEFFDGTFQNLPINQDVQVKSISLNAKLNSGYLGDNTIAIVLTGKDSGGVTHEIEVICNASVSNVGSTIPNTIDTTGKTVTPDTGEDRD